MNKKIFLVFIGTLILFACENKIEKQMKGVWVINELYYNNQNVKKYFSTNGLIITDDTCSLPIQNNGYIGTPKEYGIWSTFKKNDKSYFKIQTANPFFNDTYEITKIWKDCNDHGCLIRLNLQSDSTFIECSKSDY